MKMPVPAPLRLALLSTSSVFTSPPVVIDAPGRMFGKGDPIDGAGPVRNQGPGEGSALEAQDAADRAAVDRDLADVQDVASVCLAVGEAVREALLLRHSERVDGQLGVQGRAVDDDPDSPARHRVGPNSADRLRVPGILLRRPARPTSGSLKLRPARSCPSAMFVASVFEV